jgi:glycosyltransferase involved in cell wall biosynthesis
MHLEADVYHYRPLDHLLRRPARLRWNLRALEASATELKPDVVFIWGMWNLSPSVAARAERLYPGRIVYSFADCWPIEPDVHQQYWHATDGSGWSRRLRRALAPLMLSRLYRPVRPAALHCRRSITCSRFLLDRLRAGGLTLPDARVVFSGIDLARFVPPATTRDDPREELRVIYAGSVVPHKGVHTAIKALQMLVEGGCRAIHLTVVGRGHPTYLARLEGQIAQTGIAGWVHLTEAVPREQMPRLLQQFDVMVLPTLTEEPLSRAVMEAMACGLVVVASRTGGTPEMVTDGVNGMLFSPGESRQLASHLERLATDRTLREQLSSAAQQTAGERFCLGRMIDEIEEFLCKVHAEAHSLTQDSEAR